MTSCERCWWEAQRRGIEYRDQLKRAEANGEECTRLGPDGKLTEDAARLRAGQFWDEDAKCDTRSPSSASSSRSPDAP